MADGLSPSVRRRPRRRRACPWGDRDPPWPPSRFGGRRTLFVVVDSVPAVIEFLSPRSTSELVEQRAGSLLQERLLAVAADLNECDVGEAGLPVLTHGVDDRIEVGPQGIDSATSSLRTNCVAPSKPAVVGRSAFTAQPPANQRNCSCARSTAAVRSGSQQIGIWPITRTSPGRPVARRASCQESTRSLSGSTAMR